MAGGYNEGGSSGVFSEVGSIGCAAVETRRGRSFCEAIVVEVDFAQEGASKPDIFTPLYTSSPFDEIALFNSFVCSLRHLRTTSACFAACLNVTYKTDASAIGLVGGSTVELPGALHILV
jgi:hypothetical protein